MCIRDSLLHRVHLGEISLAGSGVILSGAGLLNDFQRLLFGLFQLLPCLMPLILPIQFDPALLQRYGFCLGAIALLFALGAKFGSKRLLAGKLTGQSLQRLLFRLAPVKGANRNSGVRLQPGQGLQQYPPVVFIGFLKRGKLVLSQQHGAGELLKR